MIFVLKLVSGRRRLIRKNMYRAPHERENRNTYFRENKKLNKSFQDEYVNTERIFTKRRPKREAVSGFKMSYRYKYYNQENLEEEEEEDEEL